MKQAMPTPSHPVAAVLAWTVLLGCASPNAAPLPSPSDQTATLVILSGDDPAKLRHSQVLYENAAFVARIFPGAYVTLAITADNHKFSLAPHPAGRSTVKLSAEPKATYYLYVDSWSGGRAWNLWSWPERIEFIGPDEAQKRLKTLQPAADRGRP